MKTLIKYIFIALLFFSTKPFAQGTGAIISGNKLQIPRVHKTDITFPLFGMILCDPTDSLYYGYNGKTWINLGGGGAGNETDPIFLASVARFITNSEIGNWNLVYQWYSLHGWSAYTPASFVPQSRTITINGIAYDLSANRTWTINAGGSLDSNKLTLQNAFNKSVAVGELFPNINTGINSFYVRGQDANHRIVAINSQDGTTNSLSVNGLVNEINLTVGNNSFIIKKNYLHSSLPSVLNYALVDSSGHGDFVPRAAGAPLTNIGNGFKLGVSGTNNIKTIVAGNGIAIDSNINPGSLTIGIPPGSFSEADPVFTANGVPKTRILNINGVPYDLSQDRSWNISTGSGSGSFNFDSALATKTTNNLNEGSTNKYYSDARARLALFVLKSPLSYNNSTGVFDFDSSKWHSKFFYDGIYQPLGNYITSFTETDPLYSANGVPKSRILNINGVSYDLSQDRSWTISAGGSSSFAGLNDVNLTSPANGQLTRYNTTTGKWENFTPGYLTSFTETDPIYTANGVSLSGTQTLTNKTLTAPNLNSSSTPGYVWTASNTSGAGSWQAAASGGTTTTLTGAVTGTGTGTIPTTLSNTGVSAGVYSNPTLGITADGRIYSASGGGYLASVSQTRSAPATIGNAVDIGSFSAGTAVTMAGTFEIWVSIQQASVYSSKRYLLSVISNATAGNWQKLLPINSVLGGAANDYDLEIRSVDTAAFFRLRKTSGSSAGNFIISINYYGTAVTFYSSSTSAAVTAPTATYTGSQAEGFATKFMGVNQTTLTTSRGALQVGNTVNDLGSTSLENWGGVGQVPAVFITPTNNGGGTASAAFPAMILGRPGSNGAYYPNISEFKLRKFEVVGNGARTALDITASYAGSEAAFPTIMTIRSDLRVGINNTAPAYTLDVAGTIGTTRPIATSGSTPSYTLGTAAGTSATASITGNDGAGYITINTGTSPAADATILTLTFTSALTNTPKIILLDKGNALAATDVNRYYNDVTLMTTTAFIIKANGTLSASSTYKIQYHVIQ